MQIWDWLVYPVNLTPHGYCLLWAPGLIWLHATSDVIIGLAYFSIPLALGWFVHKRKDLEYRWVFLLFVCFILACGMTHFMAVYTLWVAAYGLEGLIKLITAILSVATAVLLWPLIPRLLALPSPAQLEAVNATLSDKIKEQERTYAMLLASEEKVRKANAELEERVALRTADLTAANHQLEQTLEQLGNARTSLEATVAERTEALKQRDLLLREVYHRVKNNLQVVDAVLLMQANALEDREDKTFIESLRGRIYALGLVHQQLMTSSDYQTFDLAPFLEELIENLVAAGAQGKVDLEVEAFPLTVGLDFAVPMGLIVTELVTNSLKHAFADGNGKLKISVTRDNASSANGEIVVTVSDNGSGAADVGGETGKRGIGTKLIEGLLRQLRGRMFVKSGDGMMTQLILPHPRAI
tara:strand:+ start:2562 stop:3797 length:1236 start_codon:yes stop_codon:yes gene_type:complete